MDADRQIERYRSAASHFRRTGHAQNSTYGSGAAQFVRRAFDRLPMAWWWRPAAWPIWNHEISRAVCFWSATAGLDQEVLDALTDGRIDQLHVDEPADGEQLVEQLILERDVGRHHVTQAVAGFYDRGWRGEHTADGVYPGDHLWWATAAYLDLDNAVKNYGR